LSRILIAYSSVDGHTRKICDRIAERVAAAGHAVQIDEIVDNNTLDVTAFDCIVIGASIRYGKHRPNVFDFIEHRRAVLEAKPTAFFTVNVVARKPGKDTPEGNSYLQKFLEQSRWKPTLLGVFAGKIDYARYGPVDRAMIRFIMWMTKGPTNPKTCVEFTDWAAVDRFAEAVSRLVTRAPLDRLRDRL
jgi:menaquinone-dependent protoporphyrinogen oxidase